MSARYWARPRPTRKLTWDPGSTGGSSGRAGGGSQIAAAASRVASSSQATCVTRSSTPC